MVRRRKIILTVALVGIILATVGFSWFLVFLNVDFWLNTSIYYQKSEAGWTTVNFQNNASATGTFAPINCKNNGLLPATFEITAVFSGASFSKDTPMPYQQINETAATFTFTLGSFQEKKADAYFSILNETGFSISLSITSNQALLRVATAQKSSIPWDRSYRQLIYGNSTDDKFCPALIS
jgi:hypothetical protein